MRFETKVRVSPEMRKLLDDEVNWHRNQGVNITMVEASRIIARRDRERRGAQRSQFKRNKETWERGLGLK